MKKSGWILVAASLVVTALLCLTATGCSAGEHKHDKSEIQSVVSPTCTERGYTVYLCSCQLSFIDDYVPATGHTFEEREGKDPTCLEDGWSKYRECNVCGFKTKEVIPAHGHQEVTFGTAVEPTCQKEGMDYGYKCGICGIVFREPQPLDKVDHYYRKGVCVYCEREEQYVAKFVARGETVDEITFTVSTAEDVVAPSIPQKEGYENCRWKEYELSYGDATIELLYDLTEYNIEYDGYDGDYNSNRRTYTIESEFEFLSVWKTGYTFTGWYDGDTKVGSIQKGTTGDMRLTAHWELTEYDISYGDVKTGSTEGFPVSYNMNSEDIVLPQLDAPGYVFGGWLYSGKPITVIKKGSAGNVYLRADLTPLTYTVTLEADGGKISAITQEVEFGAQYRLPVPVKERHTFLGWYDGPEAGATEFTSEQGSGIGVYRTPSDITLYAHWEVIKFWVEFHTDGGTKIEPKQYEIGTYFKAPPEPVKEGLYFDGWYTYGGERYTGNTVITQGVALRAKWIESIGVSDAEGFIAIADAPDKNYHLLCDIDLRGHEWTPIPTFTGTIDGKGCTVKNFGISRTVTTDTEYGFIRNNQGTVKNLDLADVTYNVKVNYTAYQGTFYGGFIAAKNSGTIENVRLLSGTFTYNYSIDVGYVYDQNFYLNVGGIVGCNTENGTVSGCTCELATSFGVVHYNSSGAYDAHFYLHAYTGGVVGYNEGLVENCGFMQELTVNSRVNGDKGAADNNMFVGGLVGRVARTGIVRECSASGTYSLVPTPHPSKYRVTGYFGGAIGGNGGVVENSFVSATMIGGGYFMGGFVGVNLENGTVRSCYTSAVVNNDDDGYFMGGFVGENRSTVQNCYCTGAVVSSAQAIAGGFAGSNTSSGTVKKSYSAGDISIKSGTYGRFVARDAGALYKVYFIRGMTANVGGQYATAFSDAQNAEVKGVSLSDLWSDEFLVDTLYWDEEGWVILTDEHPMLLFELQKSHDFDTAVTDADCLHGGFTVYSCKDCDKVFVMDFVPSLGHDYEAVQTIPPTCRTEGYTLKKCVRCGAEEKTDRIAATGHPEHEVTLKTAHGATCTEGGYYVYHCDACGNDFTVTEQAKGHNGVLKSTTVAPTCTSEGEAVYLCTVCDSEYTATLECTEHSWIDVAYKAPTCGVVIDDDGHKTVNAVDGHEAGVKCSVCGEIDYGCGTIAAHSFESVSVVTAPTCSAEGLGVFKCTICETEEEMPITALAHADQNADYVCDTCGTLLFTDSVLSSFTHISDAAGLAAISKNPSGNYWLDADVDLSGVAWTPIGTQARPFKGIFYGGGHKVSHLSFDFDADGQADMGGLFGYNSGLILCLNLSDFEVEITNTDATFGGIAAYNNGRIVSCNLLGTNTVKATTRLVVTDYDEHVVELKGSFIGGIAGVSGTLGKIENCKVSGSIRSEYTNVCIVSSAKATKFLQSLIHGTVAKTEQHITFGGIVGRNEGGIKSCEVTGAVSADVSVDAQLSWMKGKAYAYSYIYAGALTGYNSGSISDCVIKPMTYDCTAQTPTANLPQIFEGKLYVLCTAYYNYAQTQGIDGVVGGYSEDSVIVGVTAA